MTAFILIHCKALKKLLQLNRLLTGIKTRPKVYRFGLRDKQKEKRKMKKENRKKKKEKKRKRTLSCMNGREKKKQD